MRPDVKVANPLRSSVGRYAILLVGLGAAGMAIGWAAPGAGALIRRR